MQEQATPPALAALEGPITTPFSWRYAVPKDVVVMLVAVLAYCVALLMGLSFYIATSLFLYGTMCYLTRKNYLKNVLWTALVMAFIVVVFRMLFSVVFP